jgi:splicing factor 3A subunit 3
VPLIKIGSIIDSVTESFRTSWLRTGGSTGWQEKIGEALLATTIGTNIEPNDNDQEAKNTMTLKIDLGSYESAQDLARKVDGDTLKAELSRLGLKCGGTVEDRAKRLYLLKNTKLEDLPQKVFVNKPTKNASKDATANIHTDSLRQEDTVHHAKNERRIDIAYREAIVTALLGQLGPTLEATIRRAERRQTQTLKEREREMDEELYGSGVVAVKGKKENGDDDSSDEDDAPIYNPKNVPLDFDGKPIPYWLFKLHGLNHYYPCEICGGEAYRGRRNFELHFGDQKHTAGMRLLGIPNTKHFHGVTKIEDAQVLWHSLQEKLQQNKFDERNDEEYEDSHGNVLSRSAYEDLARQNLL